MLYKKYKEIIKNNRFAKYYFFIAPLLLMISMDILRFTGLTYPHKLLSPFLPLKMLVSYLYILFMFGFLAAIIRHKPTAFLITSVILWIMSLTSTILAEITGDPLLPSDILLATNVNEISSFVKIDFSIFKIISFLVVAFAVSTYYKCNKYSKIKMPLWLNGAATVGTIVVFLISTNLLCLNINFRYNILSKMDVEFAAFNPIENYDANGLILNFFPRIGNLITKVPETYSPETIAEIRERKPESEIEASSEMLPTVIAIQNEAWWDTSLIPNAEITPDPMARTRKIMEEGHGGLLFSSVYAGGTCMPEFEFISGLSAVFLPWGTYPYIQHIVDDTHSIVQEFKNNGYETVAFHPYKKNFYNRSKAYPLLGFDEFLGEELEGLEKSGAYISDMSVTDTIIQRYENRKADNLFMFTVTMQNHGGYQTARYENYDVEVTSTTISEEDLVGVKEHAQGVYETDVAFEKLVDYFREVDEPVIIVMYGDHLPLLGTNMSTLKKGGFVANEEGIQMQDYPALYETPYVLWTNYDTSEYEIPKRVSPANLGVTVMKMAGLENTGWYFDTIESFYKKYPVYHEFFVFNNELEQLTSIDKSDEKLLNDYKMIQYDVLHGKNYFKNE